MLRNVLEKYGLTCDDIDALMANFKSVEDIIDAEPSEISSISSLSTDEVKNLQKFLKGVNSKNGVGHDFLKRWGKVTSEEDLKAAYEEYTRLSKLYPNSPVVWEIRGDILEKMGSFKDARKSYEKAYMLYLKKGEEPPANLKKKFDSQPTITPKKVGLSNGFGNINGFKNGFKNGIVNGIEIVNGTGEGRKAPQQKGWKVLISVLIVFLIISAPLMGMIFFEKHYTYAVDGNFQEWVENIPYYGLKSEDKNINVNFVKFHISTGGIYFYLDANKNLFTNASGIYIFLDTDNNSHTGYLVEGIGADYMVEIYGWNRTLQGKELYKFNGTNQLDFNNFTYIGEIKAIDRNGQIEGFINLQVSGFRSFVFSSDYKGIQAIVPCMDYGKHTFIAEESALTNLIPLYQNTPLLKINIIGKNIRIHRIVLENMGNVGLSAIKSIELYEGNKNGSFGSWDKYIASADIKGKNVEFNNLNLDLHSNSTLFITVKIENASLSTKTFMLKINTIEANMPYYIDNDISGAAYINKFPSHPVIDGAFADWKNYLRNDSSNDVVAPDGKIVNGYPNIDLLQYGAYNEQYLYMFLKVRGKILGGADVPKIEVFHPPDSDGDTVPDKYDPYPHDFNNDGIPDNESYVIVNGTKLPDVDGDGIPDYPYGPDMWLNTTIPSWFPKPYAGRQVHRYIGPVPHKVINGMDTIEIYINSDNNTHTGYSLPKYPIGADYKIEMFGNDGIVYNASLFNYSNGKWIFVKHISPKIGYHAMELNTGVETKSSKEYIFIFDWRNDKDVADVPLEQKIKEEHQTLQKNISITSNTYGIYKTLSITHPHLKYVGKLNTTSLKATLFGNDVLITTSTTQTNEAYPSIVKTSDGTLWVAYNSSAGYIKIANSTDGGQTWNLYYITYTKNDSYPVITKDSQDNIYIFFDNFTSGSVFSYLIYNTRTDVLTEILTTWGWENTVDISAATYTDSLGNTYVYVAYDYINGTSDYNVGLIKIINNEYLYDYYNFANSSYIESIPRIAISTGTLPKVFVTFYEDNDRGIVIANNTGINSTEWSGKIIYGSFNGYYGYYRYTFPSIYASGDYVYVAFSGWYVVTLFGIILKSNWDVGLIVSTDNGNTWSNVIWVNNSRSRDNEVYPWVVANGTYVYVFYLDYSTGYICMKESTDAGNTWNPVETVSDQGSGVAIYGTVAAYIDNNNVYVVWTDSRNGDYDIYFDKIPEFHNFAILIIPLLAIILISRRRKNKQ